MRCTHHNSSLEYFHSNHHCNSRHKIKFNYQKRVPNYNFRSSLILPFQFYKYIHLRYNSHFVNTIQDNMFFFKRKIYLNKGTRTLPVFQLFLFTLQWLCKRSLCLHNKHSKSHHRYSCTKSINCFPYRLDYFRNTLILSHTPALNPWGIYHYLNRLEKHRSDCLSIDSMNSP